MKEDERSTDATDGRWSVSEVERWNEEDSIESGDADVNEELVLTSSMTIGALGRAITSLDVFDK